ncbi:MAG: PorT family protein [Mucilaginibacter polytrichastri]|nr:PorT family protein [Mucilaginibacter polytrichastri]
MTSLTKTLITCCMMLAVANFSAAQKQTSVGIKAGGNFASLPGLSDVSGYEMNSTILYHGGLYADIGVSDKFSVQPELLYSAQGAENTKLTAQGNDGNTYNVSLKYALTYVTLPVILQYQVIPSLRIGAGPYVGYLISAKEKVKITGTQSENQDTDIKEDLKKIDAGLGFGASYLVGGQILVYTRYNLGLMNVADNDGTNSIKNSVFQLGIGLQF